MNEFNFFMYSFLMAGCLGVSVPLLIFLSVTVVSPNGAVPTVFVKDLRREPPSSHEHPGCPRCQWIVSVIRKDYE
jgi:hypothetical protein